jgi:hypothetical protein
MQQVGGTGVQAQRCRHADRVLEVGDAQRRVGQRDGTTLSLVSRQQALSSALCV